MADVEALVKGPFFIDGSIMITKSIVPSDVGTLVKGGETNIVSLNNVNIRDAEGIQLADVEPKGDSITPEKLSPELREYLGIKGELARKKCPRCEEERVMDEADYICRICRG